MIPSDTHQLPLPSSRAQTRDLPNDKDTSPHLGDGGCFSAMTSKDGRVLHFGEIVLPASKSESNRALMMAAYGGFAPDFQNLSDSSDTRILQQALRDIDGKKPVIDIADCGTAARFLTTFLACREGRWLLTGTERMKQRPIQPLVEALLSLGAEIQYVEKEGFLPLQIVGNPISGGKACIDMTQSSQFASSLLLAAPMFPQGLELALFGSLNSLPYLDMTLALMRHFGAEAERIGRKVVVMSKPYQPTSFIIESDWTAASYWYEMAALSEECEIRLRGHFDMLNAPKAKAPELVEEPTPKLFLQGDAVIAEWMQAFGVQTFESDNSLVLSKMPFEKKPLSFDFSNAPDLFPTIVATCAGLQIEARFTGIANLRVKESDRVGAMRTELAKIGTELNYLSDNELVLVPAETLSVFEASSSLLFSSHGDHRIVMALAPLAMKLGHVTFDFPIVVEKSYPSFWTEASFLNF